MSFDEPCFRDTDEEMVRATPTSDHPYFQGITFERLALEGWALLKIPEDHLPFAEGGFPTTSGKCEFYSESLAHRGLNPLLTYEPARESPAEDLALAARYPLTVITAKSGLRFLTSSYANLPHHFRAEREPLLDMHTDDALREASPTATPCGSTTTGAPSSCGSGSLSACAPAWWVCRRAGGLLSALAGPRRTP